ncbi:MAG: RecX family transcriptional regulator [Bacteroidales bacterium]|jgi:regulatory protein|nr:RecX family transcriptional regulator [Bacteroidales bacterium]
MDDYKKWLMQMQRLCSVKEYCIYDINEKLKKSPLNEEDRKNIIDDLIKQNYINEQRYVQAFIHDKLYLSKWGLTKIKFSLKQKNINAELYKEIINEIEEEKYVQSFISLAKSKWKNLKESDPYVRKQKLIRYLMGRGIEYDIAEKIQRLLE